MSMDRSLFPILLVSVSQQFRCATAETKEQSWARKWQREKESWAKQGEKGRGGHLGTANKFWSKFRSRSSGCEVCFKQKSPHQLPKALLCLNVPYPYGSYHLSLFLMPASSFHTSSNPKPISPFPSRLRVALYFAVFASYFRPSHSAPSCLFHSPPLLSLRPSAFSLFTTDERRNKWRGAC